MDEYDWLAERFEAHRAHLRAVACCMLGELSEADNAAQEVWLCLSGSDTRGVENLGNGWRPSSRASASTGYACTSRNARSR